MWKIQNVNLNVYIQSDGRLFARPKWPSFYSGHRSAFVTINIRKAKADRQIFFHAPSAPNDIYIALPRYETRNNNQIHRDGLKGNVGRACVRVKKLFWFVSSYKIGVGFFVWSSFARPHHTVQGRRIHMTNKYNGWIRQTHPSIHKHICLANPPISRYKAGLHTNAIASDVEVRSCRIVGYLHTHTR